jgi:hypothetical protein
MLREFQPTLLVEEIRVVRARGQKDPPHSRRAA